MPDRDVEVAIVGGGPAGTALATRLAAGGTEVVVMERSHAPRWRACGVYSSPLTRAHLADLALGPDTIDALIRPIATMRVSSVRGPEVALEYEAPHACGIDRMGLDEALLEHAENAGAIVHRGSLVRTIEPAAGSRAARLIVSGADESPRVWRARLVVGADGPSSMVARAHGVNRPSRHLRHAGLTCHHADPEAAQDGTPMDARMILGDGWYCGVAPVPRGRVNIGIVMGEQRLREHLRMAIDPPTIVRQVIDHLPAPAAAWSGTPPTDHVAVALPLAHGVTRRAGAGFLLVGDAAGFVDPLSGDGLHRALLSAAWSADAITRWRSEGASALERYDGRMRARFAPKDLVSWILQLFLARPGLAAYAVERLARRPVRRRTFAAVMADLAPARGVLEPGFLVGLLAP